MNVEFEQFGGSKFLKIRPGCYVRIRDISGVNTGLLSGDDGSELEDRSTVVVHVTSGMFATFEACDTEEEAIEMADKLIQAIESADGE